MKHYHLYFPSDIGASKDCLEDGSRLPSYVMRPRILFAIAAMILASGLASASQQPEPQDSDRPACTSQNTGELYPAAANKDRELAQKLVRCGQLEICTRTGTWRYKWQHLSITLDQMIARKNGTVPPTPNCDVK